MEWSPGFDCVHCSPVDSTEPANIGFEDATANTWPTRKLCDRTGDEEPQASGQNRNNRGRASPLVTSSTHAMATSVAARKVIHVSTSSETRNGPIARSAAASIAMAAVTAVRRQARSMSIVDGVMAQLADADERRYRRHFHFPCSDRSTDGPRLVPGDNCASMRG